MLSLRKGTVLEGTKLSYRFWALGIYLFTTNIKGASSMRLYRELGIGQKTAWFMLHRLREAFENEVGVFSGPAEPDESYSGGVRKNMSKSKRAAMTGRGTAGKTAVAGIKDRETNKVRARVVPDTRSETLVPFVEENVFHGAIVCTDDAKAYGGLSKDSSGFFHQSVKHRVGEYVRDQAHTNGIESFWSMLKRGYVGIYHKMSPKHLDRYVLKFYGRHNVSEMDTMEQMRFLVLWMENRRLKYEDLILDNGLSSGARG